MREGNKNGRYAHGRAGTPEYSAYKNAEYRCAHQEGYVDRGIKFLFTSLEQFLAELGPRPEGMTLDRINNDGNYEPGNVRWATPLQQRLNQRKRKEYSEEALARIRKGVRERLSSEEGQQHIRRMNNRRRGRPAWNKGIPTTRERDRKGKFCAKVI